MDKKYCKGCYNNIYNGGMAKECWSFKTAKVVWRIPIGMQESPPYKNRKQVRVANCFRGKGPYRTIYIKPEVLTKDGYWK